MAPKMTIPLRFVLNALLHATARGEEMYGLQIADVSGVDVGTIYPILARLEREGWLESRWEDIDPSEEQRPRRHYYRIRDTGEAEARAALDATGFGKLSIVKP